MKRPAGLVLGRVVREGVSPHAGTIENIGLTGEVVVVVFEPSEEWKGVLRKWGWRNRPVFKLPRSLYPGLATADLVTARWLRRTFDGKTIRIFLVVNYGSFLMNFDQDSGLSLEPGSTDAELYPQQVH